MKSKRMNILSPLLVAAIAVVVVGCDAPAERTADAAAQATSPQKKEDQMSVLKPPSPDSVLYFIW
ncbi:hypothetical protein [Pseudoxanthomonas sp.]|jgi:hypothetical protein|uniref:hypothetical protein n=1 Tax=Pseudoxanthomonas sp. TaxID=1871049 RepID=UPI002FE0B33F